MSKNKLWKLMLIIFVVILAFFSFCDRTQGAISVVSEHSLEKALPDFSEWRYFIGSKGEKILQVMHFDDGMQPKNLIVFWIYKDEDNTKPELLIWREYVSLQGGNDVEISTIHRFYKWVDGDRRWERVGDIVVIDAFALEPGEEIPVFSEDSEFGKLFFELFKKAGIPKKEIIVPFVSK